MDKDITRMKYANAELLLASAVDKALDKDINAVKRLVSDACKQLAQACRREGHKQQAKMFERRAKILRSLKLSNKGAE